ncbi:MAG: antibiotic biosynthesis monooxygenase [Myxococcales bacterium]
MAREADMIVTVFRSRVRKDLSPEALAHLEERGARMVELATSMPGFISYKDFAAADGESLTLVEFDNLEHQEAWRDHPEHRELQVWSREFAFESYQIQVCEPIRVRKFG